MRKPTALFKGTGPLVELRQPEVIHIKVNRSESGPPVTLGESRQPSRLSEETDAFQTLIPSCSLFF